MILTGNWKTKKPKKPEIQYSLIRLKKFDNFPVVVSWIQGEDIEIQFAKSDHDNDEVMAEVMRIIQNEMKEIEDADI
jgi:uncharacterized protein (DUF169 family)